MKPYAPKLMNLKGNILLLGGSGMLGKAWKYLLDIEGVKYIAPTSADLNVGNHVAIKRYITSDIRYVINCSGYTDVDACETQTVKPTLVNGIGPRLLANRCQKTGSVLIHYSTDYIFNGNSSNTYSIDDKPDPVNFYGQSKLMGERYIRNSGCNYLIIRTSFLYAPWAKISLSLC